MSEDSSTSCRDYSADMSALIEDIVGVDGDVANVVAAYNLVTRLQEEDPDLLSGWLHANAKAIIADVINRRLASTRSKARHHAKRRAFAASAKLFAQSGDAEHMSKWLEVRYSVADNTQRRLMDMTGEDLLYVASRYGRNAKAALLEEAFLRALAAKVGNNTVKDVMTPDQIDRVYASFSSGTSTAAS